MSENPTDPAKEPPKPPPKTKPPQAGGNGKLPKHPAQNGVRPHPKNWDFVETPDLDKEDVESSKDKK